jgi:hypothetical protein
MKRRLLFAVLGVLLLGIVLFRVATSTGPRYRAESFIIVKPYTNAVFARSFEAQVLSTIPGVLRLEVVPARSAILPSMTPGATNGAGIRILAVGATAEGAHYAATNAATRLCVIIHDLYGSTGELVDTTDRSRRYSFFHDSLQPNVIRMFKH